MNTRARGTVLPKTLRARGVEVDELANDMIRRKAFFDCFSSSGSKSRSQASMIQKSQDRFRYLDRTIRVDEQPVYLMFD